jgi:hypothetical protein
MTTVASLSAHFAKQGTMPTVRFRLRPPGSKPDQPPAEVVELLVEAGEDVQKEQLRDLEVVAYCSFRAPLLEVRVQVTREGQALERRPQAHLLVEPVGGGSTLAIADAEAQANARLRDQGRTRCGLIRGPGVAVYDWEIEAVQSAEKADQDLCAVCFRPSLLP